MPTTTHTTDIAKYYMQENNILVVELFPDAIITLKDAEETSFHANAHANVEHYLVLLDTSGHNTWDIPSEVLKYLANNEYSKNQTAFAIVVNSLPMRIIARFFISFHKPIVPTKLFTSREGAEKWLLSKTN